MTNADRLMLTNMARALPLAAALLLLAGCGKGYAIDRFLPETRLVNPQLARYGLAPEQVHCVGNQLAASLSPWQMRLLAMKAGAVTPGGAYPEKLRIRDLLWVAGHVNDADVGPALMRATGACAVPLVETRSIEAAALPTAAEFEEETGPTSGPRRYLPSEDLLQALEAYGQGDFNRAAILGAAAAAKGDSGAHQFLGGLYSTGHGVVADAAMAVRLYRIAAEHGWAEAMNNLGRAYETGEGVARDPVEALKWYLLASARPTEEPELVQRNIAHVVADMTTEDIGRSAERARQWEQAHGNPSTVTPHE